MSFHDLLLIVHILLLVAWLGIDVGVFYSSFVMRRPGLSIDARRQVRKVMVTLDLAPRISLILMIPSGLGLAYVSGFGFAGFDRTITASVLWLVTAGAIAWVVATVWAFRARQADPAPRGVAGFDRVDWWSRAIASLAFLAMGISSLLGYGPFPARWLAWKVLLFGLIVAAGLWIRLAARRYRPALAQLLEHGESPERLAAVNRTIRGVYPAVLSVWTGLIIIVVLAVVRP